MTKKQKQTLCHYSKVCVETSLDQMVALQFIRLLLRYLRRVQERKHVFDHLPQTVVEREVVVHQIDQEVVVVDVLNDHARGRFVLVQLRPLFDPQRESLVLWKQTKLSSVFGSHFLFECTIDVIRKMFVVNKRFLSIRVVYL